MCSCVRYFTANKVSSTVSYNLVRKEQKNLFQLYLSKVSEQPVTVWKSSKNTLSNDIHGALLLKLEHKGKNPKAQRSLSRVY